MNHNNQKKIAAINDFSGFGRCSLAVSLPVISHMKVQCCPIPTSIFSNHTGFPSFFFDDYTEKMLPYMEEWKKLNLQFNGITTGFLGSARQIDIVEQFLREFRTEDTLIIVDPVMGDCGKAYATYTEEMCELMRALATQADVLTPNLTEACILTGRKYREGIWEEKELHDMAKSLSREGKCKVVITGIFRENQIGNYVYEAEKYDELLLFDQVGEPRSGTGDIFSAIIAADAVNHIDFRESVDKASNFITACIEASLRLEIPKTDGVCFEEVLHLLK